MHRRLVVTAIAGALLVVAGGCGDDEQAEGDATTSTTSTTSTTAAPTSSSAATSATTAAPTTAAIPAPPTTVAPDPLDPADPTLDGEGFGDIEAFAPDLLLVGGDLGPSFVDTGYLPGPGPCGADLDDQVPVDVLVGTELESPGPAAVVRQELRVYADDAAAGQAFAGAVGGCGEVTDRTVELGFDAFSAPVAGGQVVVVLLSDAVISLVVTGDTTAVDPIRTATTAVEKVLAASATGGTG